MCYQQTNIKTGVRFPVLSQGGASSNSPSGGAGLSCIGTRMPSSPLRHLAVCMVCLVLAGCATPTTTVDFDAPRGSSIKVEKERVVLAPSPLVLKQRTESAALNKDGYSIDMQFADPVSGASLPITGKLYVYRARLSDVDTMARNSFTIPPEKVEALKQGAAVTIEGMSADGGKLLYRAILGLRRNVPPR